MNIKGMVGGRPVVQITLLTALLLVVTGASRADHAPTARPDSAPRHVSETLSISVEGLVARVALYPDDLLSVVMAASTFPLQVDQAAGFLERQEYDSNLQPEPEWDDSIVALLNYPDVVALMNADLDWTRRLGEAVQAHQSEVIDAVQRFRNRAVLAGNLVSDDRQIVADRDGVIKITPVDPQAIYVPHYDPGRIIYRSSAPVYHYYPNPYPSYYYPYPAGRLSRFQFFWGVTSVFTIGWHGHRLGTHRHGHRDHPYYGRYYPRRHSYLGHKSGLRHRRHLNPPHHRPARRGGRRAEDRTDGHRQRVNPQSAGRSQGSAGRRATRSPSTDRRRTRRNTSAAGSRARSDSSRASRPGARPGSRDRSQRQSVAATRRANSRAVTSTARTTESSPLASTPGTASPATARPSRSQGRRARRGMNGRHIQRERRRRASSSVDSTGASSTRIAGAVGSSRRIDRRTGRRRSGRGSGGRREHRADTLPGQHVAGRVARTDTAPTRASRPDASGAGQSRRSAKKQRRRRPRALSRPTPRVETAARTRGPASPGRARPNRPESRRQARGSARGRPARRSATRRTNANKASRRARSSVN